MSDSEAKWSARRTRNPAVPGSCPALATCIVGFVLGLPSLNPQPPLYIYSQLVSSCQVGFFILFFFFCI